MMHARNPTRIHASGWCCVLDSELTTEATARNFETADAFDRILRTGERCPGGRSDNILIDPDDSPDRLRLRELRHGGLIGGLAGNRYASPRACEREFRVWKTLESRGAPIPVALLAAGRRRGLFWNCVFGSRNIEAANDVLTWLASGRREIRQLRTAAAAIADHIRRFHDARAIHGDLHLANILIEPLDRSSHEADVNTPRCWLVDLTQTQLVAEVTPSDRMSDVMRLWRSIEKTGHEECLHPAVLARFIATYCRGNRQLRKEMLAFAPRELRRLQRHRFGWKWLGRSSSRMKGEVSTR